MASHGRSHRIAGIKTGRVHHFLSDIERDAFYQFDWADTVTDIREQYPLDREYTRRIAADLEIKHDSQSGGTSSPKLIKPACAPTFLFPIAVFGRQR